MCAPLYILSYMMKLKEMFVNADFFAVFSEFTPATLSDDQNDTSSAYVWFMSGRISELLPGKHPHWSMSDEKSFDVQCCPSGHAAFQWSTFKSNSSPGSNNP